MPNQSNWSAQEKLDIVLKGLKGERTIRELCSAHGISEPTYYNWRRQFLDGAKSGLRDSTYPKKQVIKQRIRDVERMIGRVVLESNLLEESFNSTD